MILLGLMTLLLGDAFMYSKGYREISKPNQFYPVITNINQLRDRYGRRLTITLDGKPVAHPTEAQIRIIMNRRYKRKRA